MFSLEEVLAVLLLHALYGNKWMWIAQAKIYRKAQDSGEAERDGRWQLSVSNLHLMARTPRSKIYLPPSSLLLPMPPSHCLLLCLAFLYPVDVLLCHHRAPHL